MPHDHNMEDYDMNEMREEYIARMEEEGFEIRYPAPGPFERGEKIEYMGEKPRRQTIGQLQFLLG